MSTFHLALGAALAAILLAVGFRIESTRRFKALRWPANQGYYGFRRRVMRYLSQAGWRVDKRTTLQVDFFAHRNRKQFAVICLPTDIAVTRSRVQDLASLPHTSTRASPVVCVTLDKVPIGQVQEAAAKNIRIIWYKDLASF